MLPPIVSEVLPLLLLLAILWLLSRLNDKSGDNQEIIRLQLRLDEYSKRFDKLDDKLNELRLEQQEAISQLRERLVTAFSEFREELRKILSEHNTSFEQRQAEAVKTLLESLQTGMTNIQKQVGEHLTRNSDEIGKKMEGLTQKTDHRLQEISGQVEKRLTEGFEKTTATFGDILKRLALIDEAQKKITELSTNVVNLQEILADKSSRGAFGEVQLHTLVRNVLADANYQLQYTFPNGKIADCVLFLPEPTGMVAIDSKFPLEAYRRMTDIDANEFDRKAAERQFKQDIQKHIKDISEKYILPGTTSDGAVMFIPAEAVFAEIQAHHSDLVDKAHAARVWMVSPTTLWATLNTARAVLKDAATREQVHIIQEHLGYLSKDFDRFQIRMDNLAKHIKQANSDVEEVNKSAKKISSRFEKIERVEIENDKPAKVTAISIDDSREMP
ncbi:MAG: DNA recombination protein RmuC [Gammaproteobacteria bacterium]|nr:DNA recombination protein RmuC [Gammaproteobacteria bacterium]